MLIVLFISEQGSVFGANWLAQKYSPTQRKCCVRGYRLAGARPVSTHEYHISGAVKNAVAYVNESTSSGGVLNGANSVPSFEWYLKNHLGSTMLVYGSNGNNGSVKAAYDYRAFGEQVDLIRDTEKITENFTGKEKDDETELSYFGARYLDQMLGMWVSVDAKRQFNSPYLYAGNGANPVRFFDPNGNVIIFASDKEREMYKSLWSSLSPVAQERIQALEQSKNIYNLNYRPAKTKNQEFVFDEKGDILFEERGGTKSGGFVPKSNGGDIFFDGTKESLGHELGGHGFQFEAILNTFLENGRSGENAVNLFQDMYNNDEKWRKGMEKSASEIGGNEFDENYYDD